MRVLINGVDRLIDANGADDIVKACDICDTSDVVVVDGFAISHDTCLTDGMDITIVKKGIMPSRDLLGQMMIARNGDVVNNAVCHGVVAVCGLGGLGSNIAEMLARLGVGKLIIIDFDTVDPTNLNRQNYYISDIGKSKAQSMADRLRDINPYITVIAHDVRLTSDNIMSYIDNASIVVEAFDNPECKAMLVNTVLTSSSKIVVASSGMAGYGSSNDIVTTRVSKSLYIVGDRVSEAGIGNGLMSPRVAINAGAQANMVLRILLGQFEA